MLLVLPFDSKEELAIWEDTAKQLDHLVRENCEWFTVIESDEIQHLVSNPIYWRTDKVWRECYTDLMIGFLNEFEVRTDIPIH